MDEKTAPAIEPTLYEDDENSLNNASSTNKDHGWQKVTYAKRQRKNKPSDSAGDPGKFRPNGVVVVGDNPNVFQSLEEQSKERRRRVEAQKAAAAAALSEPVPKPKHHSDDDGDDSDGEVAGGGENAASEVKKPKQKKPKKLKVTVAEAASKIDASDLAAHLVDVTASYESQQDIQLMRFADYFGRVFASVSAAQFQWTKMLKESTVAKIADIPLSHISEDVYKISSDWIGQRSPDALSSFVLWSLDSILTDLAHQQGFVRGSKKVVHQAPSKSQVAIFVVLAMVLRRKPDILISILPVLRENVKYQGQDKLPLLVWMIAQACQGDLVVGMFAWVHNLLPIVNGKNCNPQSRDLVLQLVERILSAPKARSILLNGAVRKGERLVPPSAFEMLMRSTFPAPSARVKATERFEAIYPSLKELALSGAPGSKAMKQISQQIFSIAVQAAGESTSELSKEAAAVFIWCLTQNPDCYKIWDKIYLDNIEASVVILQKLSDEWKEHSVKHSSLDPLKETLKSFRLKNVKVLASGGDAGEQASIKDADKYCKAILGRISRGHGCLKSMVVIGGVALAVAIMSPSMEFWDLSKLPVIFSAPESI